MMAGDVGVGAAHGELVVGLLVASGVDRGAHVEALGHDEHVVDALGPKPDRGGEPRRAAADHQRVDHREAERPLAAGRVGYGIVCSCMAGLPEWRHNGWHALKGRGRILLRQPRPSPGARGTCHPIVMIARKAIRVQLRLN